MIHNQQENLTMASEEAIDAHRDDEGSKLGMWLFIFTELLFFGGLFIVYAVYRYLNKQAFHFASEELDVAVGAINTGILLISSATIAMSISATQMGKKRLAISLLVTTFLIGFIFLVNKYFEWGTKMDHGLFPGSFTLSELGHGDVLFYGLYFAMTGLHALHIIIGLVFIGITISKVNNNAINPASHAYLENVGLYWHLVDIIWIFLFPLFYLIS